MANTEVRKIVLAVFSIFGTVIFLLTMSCNAFADDITPVTASSKFSVDVNNAVLELTIPSTPAVIDLNPTMTGASFGSTSIDIKVATNNITGYTLTMTPTNDTYDTSLIRTELIGDEEDYREIETLELTDPISTGYTEQTFTTNAWGYKITGDNYYGIDPENTTVSHPAWITSAPTNGTDHNLTLAAKVDAETVSGAYETTLNFRAVTNAVPKVDIVSFNGNGADSGDMSGDIISVAAGSLTTLPANTYVKSNYRFIGWNTNINGTGTSYVDEGEYVSTATTADQSVTLYAMWSNLPEGASTSGTTPNGNPGVTISRAYEIAYTAAHKGMWEKDETDDGYAQVTDGIYHNRDVRWDMQGMTSEICNSVTAIHDDYQALDIRDWKLYHITKALDGRCWLTDNLALDLLMTNAEQRITTANTNANSNALYSLFHGYRSQGANYATSGIVQWTSDAYYSVPQIYTGNINSVNESDSLPAARTYKYGIHYNYCAASAGSFCYGQEWDPGSGQGYGQPLYDICPTGWHMPTGTPDGDFKALFSKYSTIDDLRLAVRFPFSGNFQFYSGQFINGGTSGKFYTSTWAGTDYHVYGIVIRYDIVDLQGTAYRNDGYSVRCVAR